MKKLLVMILTGIVIYSCSSNSSSGEQSKTDNSTTVETASATDYDPTRGEGKFDKVEVGENIDLAMATAGKTIADVKCASCHKYGEERLVGPGWKGVSERKEPQWIMNFITNPDPMIDKDPELQAQLEVCLVRMPNQNLTDEEAREILEFMRQNDAGN